MTDPHDLGRYVRAQDRDATYERALTELRAGRKTSHWMWFVFPQVAGLGRSAMAREYAIASRAEAEAYLGHPVLGPRLVTCTRALTQLAGSSAQGVLGEVDARKLRSCLTLFAHVAPEEPVFREVLEQWFDGEEDEATLARLGPA